MEIRGFLLRCISVILVLLTLTACVQVKPWQRGNLAREDMKWNTDPRLSILREQNYRSTEGS